MKLYKFKSLEGDGLLHSLDMIVNERVFLATCESMNDPSEGAWDPKESRASLLIDGYLEQAQKLRKLVDSIGFTSFTKSFKNELLWAHYAGGFTGVCFEYEISENEYDIRSMNYDGRAVISKQQINQILERKHSPQDVGILRSKANCWAYENECRLFRDVLSKEKYIRSKPTRIIFGVKNLKYDDVFKQIAKKYEIQISYLSKVENEYSAYDI